MNDVQAVRALAALAQPARLHVFKLLVVAGRKGVTPSQLSVALDIPASSLSFHLKELMSADLVTQERDGRHLICRAQLGHMNDLLRFLTANCCEGEPCLDAQSIACTTC
ncbi:helix-turn-helix transcriptional regulator [Lacisediminimonas sp.]|uniref:ArsR/SmtB family transcription factor n=1 Tax=Lacisediminimonas sp. TaxID=3060582 RepID=UPI00271CD653|nr:metalloregulator ArsR/SmtB family transcription factor [Lacisediminimonas sp.]MDO8298790.1 metalloregulator ArsR/SmtB family transcription factor [Lacisediminimonas sp.]